MADGKIIITGDLKFVGYKQKANPGIVAQRLTFRNGEAIWEDGAKSIVTTGSDQEALLDNAGNIIECQRDDYVGIDTRVTSNSARSGRLEVKVINNTGSTLIGLRAYSLENNAYDFVTNTVTLTVAIPGTPTQGQSGLFFLETDVLNNASTIGIIKGIITTNVLQSTDAERDLKVLSSGDLSDIILGGEYVVGTITRSPLLDTPLEIAFDGLSNYKLPTADSTSIFVEENGTQISNITNTFNFGNNITAKVDTIDPRKINVDVATGGSGVEKLLPRFQVTNNSDISLFRESSGISVQKVLSTLRGESFPFVAFLSRVDDDTVLISSSFTPSFDAIFEYNISTNIVTEIVDLSSLSTTQNFTDLRAVKIGTDYYINFVDSATGPLTVLENTGLYKYNGTTLTKIVGPSADVISGINAHDILVTSDNKVWVTTYNNDTSDLKLISVDTQNNDAITEYDFPVLTGFSSVVLQTTDGTDLFMILGASGGVGSLQKFEPSTDTFTTLLTRNINLAFATFFYSSNDNSLYYTQAASSSDGLYRYSLTTNTSNKVIDSFNSNSDYIVVVYGVTDNDVWFRISSETDNVNGLYFYDIVQGTFQRVHPATTDTIVGPNIVKLQSDKYVITGFTTATSAGGLYELTGGTSSYDNNIVLPNVITNFDPAKYIYDVSTGFLTINEIGDFVFSLELKLTNSNSSNFTGNNYRIVLVDNDGTTYVPSIVTTIVDTTTKYIQNIIVTNNIPGTKYRIVEEVPNLTQFINIGTTIESGSEYTVFEKAFVFIVVRELSFITTDFVGTGDTATLTLNHGLDSQDIIVTWQNKSATTPTLFYPETEIINNNTVRITRTPINGSAIVQTFLG